MSKSFLIYKKAAVQCPQNCPFSWLNKPHFLCLSSKGVYSSSQASWWPFTRLPPVLSPHLPPFFFFLMDTLFGIWSKNAGQRGLITSLPLLALLLLIVPRLLSNLPCCLLHCWLVSSLLTHRAPRSFP